jgi:small subunit ribosomal protein S6
MNKYEAMLIFSESFKDDKLEAAMDKVKAEIEKTGGKVGGATRLGRRQFARRLEKETAGHYAVVSFELPGDKVAALHGRFKLNEEIFRVQIVRQPEVAAEPSPAPAAK